MNTPDAVAAVIPARHYLNETTGIKSWLLTTDHKRIGLLYLFSITGFFFLGGFFEFCACQAQDIVRSATRTGSAARTVTIGTATRNK